jgi:predicted Na+-dependent transporter
MHIQAFTQCQTPYVSVSCVSCVVAIASHVSFALQVAGYGIVQTVNVCTIFVISGLTLKTDDIVKSLKHPTGLVFGLVSILGLTPLLGFVSRHSQMA